jgi:hypothetical protein
VNFLQFGEFFLFLLTILSFLLLGFLVVAGGCCGGFVFGFGFCDFLLVGVGCCYKGLGFRVHVFPFFSACCSLSCSSRVLAWWSFA